jgi:hypothetical protein
MIPEEELIFRLSTWCDGLRKAIETYLLEQEESNKKLRMALSSWQTPSGELLQGGHNELAKK